MIAGQTKARHGGAEGTVSLEELLASRDRRAARQTAVLARFGAPLVSFSIVTPGPVKDGGWTGRALSAGLRELDGLFTLRRWSVLSREALWNRTGPEALLAVAAEARPLKEALIALETTHPIGRLWDLDVVTAGQRGLSRTELGYPARRCLVCGLPSHECGRSRRHPLAELLQAVEAMVENYDRVISA